MKVIELIEGDPRPLDYSTETPPLPTIGDVLAHFAYVSHHFSGDSYFRGSTWTTAATADSVDKLAVDIKRLFEPYGNVKAKKHLVSALSKLVTKVSSLRTTSERHRGQVMRFKQGLNEPFTVLKARKGPVISSEEGALKGKDKTGDYDKTFTDEASKSLASGLSTVTDPVPGSSNDAASTASTVTDPVPGSSNHAPSTSTLSMKRVASFDESTMDSIASDRSDTDPSWHPPASVTVPDFLTRINAPLPNSAAAQIRYGISDEGMAKTCQALQADMVKAGLIDTVHVLPAGKFARERKKAGRTCIAALSKIEMLGLYIDGKDDRGVWTVQKDGSYLINTAHNISMIALPGKKYIGMVELAEKGTGENIANAITEFCTKYKINQSDLVCIGGDGCLQNIGPWNGVFKCMEKLAGRPMQRVVCMLHHVELPMRALFLYYDGPKSGPNSFSGSCGQMLVVDYIHKTELRKFKPIPVDFPEVSDKVFNALSNDAKIMYCLCVGVVAGDLDAGPRKVSQLRIGPYCSARWITFGARILRLYASTEYNKLQARDQEIIDRMTLYITGVYYKVFAEIKHKDSITDSPRHLYNEIKLARDLCTKDELTVVQKSIQTNASMAHPECLMLAMCADEDEEVRNSVFNLVSDLDRLEKFRQDKERESGVRRTPALREIRSFELPRLQFSAQHYSKLAHFRRKAEYGSEYLNKGTPVYRWEYQTFTPLANNPYGWREVTKPPLLARMTQEELESIRMEPLKLDYPCHTQPVEHAVANSSRNSKKFKTAELRLGAALITVKSIARQPELITNRHYQADLERLLNDSDNESE